MQAELGGGEVHEGGEREKKTCGFRLKYEAFF